MAAASTLSMFVGEDEVLDVVGTNAGATSTKTDGAPASPASTAACAAAHAPMEWPMYTRLKSASSTSSATAVSFTSASSRLRPKLPLKPIVYLLTSFDLRGGG